VRGPRQTTTTLDSDAAERLSWTFLTNHMHVLLCIARDPTIRLRDVATLVGITERAAQSIVADLVHEGYVSRARIGRRNHYEVHAGLPLRHPLERDHAVSELLAFLGVPGPVKRRTRNGASASATRSTSHVAAASTASRVTRSPTDDATQAVAESG
jgi:hypothetical protein